MLRKLMVATLVGMLIGGTVVYAQVTFSDVTDDHPHRGDIDLAVSKGWFTGYEDGTFRPDSIVKDEHIARVVKRALGDGRTRAEFATFMRGGYDALSTKTTSPVSTAAPATRSQAWYDRGVTCERTYNQMVENYKNYYSNLDPTTYKRNSNSLGINIVSVTGWYKRFVTESFYLCQGTAKLSNKTRVPVYVYRSVDSDGDRLWGFREPWPTWNTCEEANENSWSESNPYGSTVKSYNLGYLYDPANDADGDRIMCEDILPDPLDEVGDAPSGEVAL